MSLEISHRAMKLDHLYAGECQVWVYTGVFGQDGDSTCPHLQKVQQEDWANMVAPSLELHSSVGEF